MPESSSISNSATDLPNIGAPARRALAGIGVNDLANASAYSAGELLALHGFGPKALRILEAALAARDLNLRKEQLP